MKLKPGDVCRLTEYIPGVIQKHDWKTGLYRVKYIHAPFAYGRDALDPRRQSYHFEKIKKDGTVYKNFCNGYSCLAWDRMIELSKVEIV